MDIIEKSVRDKIDWKFIQHIERVFTRFEDESEHRFRDIYARIMKKPPSECVKIEDVMPSTVVYTWRQNSFSTIKTPGLKDELFKQMNDNGFVYVFHYDIFGFDVPRSVIDDLLKRVLIPKFEYRYAMSMDGIDRYIWFIKKT